jgi:hypothetical protein
MPIYELKPDVGGTAMQWQEQIRGGGSSMGAIVDQEISVVCCVCHRERTPDGWRYTGSLAKNISHGYCPICYRMAILALKEQVPLSS